VYRIGAEAEPLHHARPIAFDQRVGAPKQRQHLLGAGLVLEIGHDLAPAAHHDAAAQSLLLFATRQRDDVGAHICQHHRSERAGAESGELHDADAGQRPAGARSDRLLRLCFLHSAFPYSLSPPPAGIAGNCLCWRREGQATSCPRSAHGPMRGSTIPA